MRKIKVIQIIDSLRAGGAEVLAVNIANGLIENNIESHICVTREEGILKSNISDSVGYLFLNRTSTLDVKAIIRLRKYIKKNGIGIIHAHSTSSFIAFIIKVLMPNVKIFWHDHFGKSEFLNKRKKYPIVFFSYFFHSIISVNTDLKNWSKEYLMCENVYFLNNFAMFNNDLKNTTLKGEAEKRIVHLAGFREQKDHLNLLKAFEIVIRKHPKWTLHLIGKSYDNEYSNLINEFIINKELQNDVFLYGVCSDIKHILAQATIGVLSSKSEGLPVSLLEYGLAKLPVLVTNVGECSLVLKNKKALVASNRSDKFALHLNELISNESVRKDISEELYNSVINNFSQQFVVKQLINIYTK